MFFQGGLSIVRRRWNDPFGTFSFIITDVGERNCKSNREEDLRKF